MRHIYNQIDKKPFLLFACIAVINTIIWLYMGMFTLKLSPDSHYYLSQADYINKNGLKAFITNNSSIPYYWGFPIYLALCKLLFGSYFNTAIIVVQFLFICVIPVLLKSIYEVLFVSSKGSLLVCCLFIFCWDAFQWGNFLLTDVYSLFLSVLFIYLILKINFINAGLLFFLIPILCISLLAFRGSNIIVILSALFYMLNYKKKSKILSGLIFIVIIIFIYILYPKQSHSNAFNVDSRYSLFEKNMKKGEVVNDRHAYDIKPSTGNDNKFVYAVKLYTLRFVNFWRFYSSDFSRSHNLFNILYFPICYLFAILSFFYKKNQIGAQGQNFILIIIALYFLSISLTMIDYDWRYRVPVLTFLLLFSAKGMSVFWESVFYKRRIN